MTPQNQVQQKPLKFDQFNNISLKTKNKIEPTIKEVENTKTEILDLKKSTGVDYLKHH